MGCALCKKKKTVVDMEKYSGFHETFPPHPTNECDRHYLEVRGETVTFGAGGDSAEFQAIMGLVPGIIRSRVGYCGGKEIIEEGSGKIHDHTEVVDVEFNPEKVAFKDLLRVFWATHDPTKLKESRRHKSVIFYHNKHQQHTAERELMEMDRAVVTHNPLDMKRVRTDVMKMKHLFLAPMESQYVYLQKDKTLWEFVNCRTTEELTFSHLACKLNSFVSGHAKMAVVMEAQKDLALTPDIVNYLNGLMLINK